MPQKKGRGRTSSSKKPRKAPAKKSGRSGAIRPYDQKTKDENVARALKRLTKLGKTRVASGKPTNKTVHAAAKAAARRAINAAKSPSQKAAASRRKAAKKSVTRKKKK